MNMFFCAVSFVFIIYFDVRSSSVSQRMGSASSGSGDEFRHAGSKRSLVFSSSALLGKCRHNQFSLSCNVRRRDAREAHSVVHRNVFLKSHTSRQVCPRRWSDGHLVEDPVWRSDRDSLLGVFGDRLPGLNFIEKSKTRIYCGWGCALCSSLLTESGLESSSPHRGDEV